MMSEATNPKLTAQISLPRGETLKFADLMTSPIREFFHGASWNVLRLATARQAA